MARKRTGTVVLQSVLQSNERAVTDETSSCASQLRAIGAGSEQERSFGFAISRADLRVVYLSGQSDEIVADHGLLEVGIVFLPKPFGPAELAAKMSEALSS